MKILTPPINVDDEHIGSVDLTRDELVARFGEGLIPNVNSFTMPGPIQIWPLLLDDGQIVVLEHHLKTGFTALLANPKDLDRALRGLGIPGERVTWRSQRSK